MRHADGEQDPAFEVADASQTAQQAAHALHAPVDRDSVPASTQHLSGSRRTTTDSVLDRVLHEVEGSSLPRQHSAAQVLAHPCGAGRRYTADTTLPATPNPGSSSGPQLAASNPMQSGSSRRSSASEGTASVNPLLSHADPIQATAGHRSTADSVLASVLDEVEAEVEDEADQASVDSLLDGVLAEVAGAACRQRTTADSVLDAMLDNMASDSADGQGDMGRQSSGVYSAPPGHLPQQQLQGVRHLSVLYHLPCLKCLQSGSIPFYSAI